MILDTDLAKHFDQVWWGILMEGTQVIPQISCLEKDFSVRCLTHWYIWSSLLLVLTIRMTCWHRWNSFQLFSYQRWVPSLRKRWQFDTDWRCLSRWIVSRILANLRKQQLWVTVNFLHEQMEQQQQQRQQYLTIQSKPKWIWLLKKIHIHMYVKIS